MEVVGTIISLCFSHPEFMKDLFFFILAWILLKRGIEKNFEKITTSIQGLTETMAKLEQSHSKRLTVLEDKVDKLANPKS